ncbi:peptidase M4 [Thermoanaerobacterium thermosaccharolyticum]|uniref:Peptidase M4 n=1 Tax=Thermoanaerobacterium thermosaccharolyticum TaxID=1517 RepID=A0A231VMU2_THETR|nr:S-layer homology domain-containing protein [Thermoanaerobacterium thermosaccharolyticum]OXT09327.1 peptidase M4 [Thermoanaerobacterium thermosaccharolyticum]
MRRFLSFLIVSLLILAAAIPSIGLAQTNSKIELKQAIEIAKEKLNIPSSGYNFNSNYYESDGNKTWFLTWTSSTKGNINVNVDADTGEIISYNFYRPDNASVSIIPKHTREEAKEVAVNFLNKIIPEKFKETKEQDIDDYYGNNTKIAYNTTYSFNFVRIVNGIPFQGNQITVEVDKNTLEVQSYYLNWGYGYSFPDPKSAISKDKALQVFKDNNSLRLQYNIVYTNVYGKNELTPQAILVYSLANNEPVDAITGKILPQGYYGPFIGGMGSKSMDNSQVLSPEEQKAVDDISLYISKDKAIESVKEKLPFTIDSKYSLSNSNLYKDSTNANSAIWSFGWTYTEGGNYNYVSAAVDATTGELKSFYRGDNDNSSVQGKTPKYTKEQLKSIAENYLAKIQPEKFKEMEYQDVPSSKYDNSPYTIFNYIYKSNGILCPFNAISISVNKYTGDIISYSLSWTDIKLPSSDSIISLDDAYKVLLNNSNFELNYIIYYSPDSNNQNSKDIRLVYQITNFNGLIDARSGAYVDYSGKPIAKDDNTQFTDIAGNWAEKDILLLAQYGIADGKDGKFMPNDYILQKDFIKMLVKSLQPNNVIIPLTSNEDENYDNYYNVAINSKIITENEKKPDSKVTRQDAAKFIVRSLNLKYIADLNNIYTLDYYKDADKIEDSSKGYVAILYGLNIMTGNNGYFNPDENLTRAQVASILVRYLRVEK